MSSGYGGGYGQNPYAQQPQQQNPYAGGPQGGYGGGGYGQEPAGNNYEMGNMNGGGYEGGENLQDFYAEVDQLREGIEKVNANISNIESLHARSLKDIDEQTSAQTQSQLNSIVAETSSLNKNLTQRIKILKGKAGRDPSKGPQVGVLDRNFKDALRRYQMVEKTFADRTREQMARQYRIVRPEATEDEVREACEGEQGQVFSQALLRGNRRGEARSALQEVQNRHNEIQKIEKTIIELATLFNEMEQLVAEQETMVEHIDQQGEEVQENVGKAQEEIGQAVEKARSRRRKKWWCMLIVLLIIIVIVIIAVVVTVVNKKPAA